jgi:hypothetical protein
MLYGFRGWYFQQMFANTYYAKPSDFSFALGYFSSNIFSLHFSPYLLIALLSLLRSTRHSLILFLCATSWVLAAILEGGDWMPFGRFMLPALILFCAAFAYSSWNSKEKLGALCILLLVSSFGLQKNVESMKYTEQTIAVEYMQIRQMLNFIGVKRVGLVDIGRFSYQSHLDVFDLAGLVSEEVAGLEGGHLSKQLTNQLLADSQVDVFLIRLSSRPSELSELSQKSFASYVEYLAFGIAVFNLDYQAALLLPESDRTFYPSFLLLSTRDKSLAIGENAKSLHPYLKLVN